ncbi:MAG: transcriptional regulator [Ruminococcus sp.]|nr:transcriptional regulator [Ruminococcus sp.]
MFKVNDTVIYDSHGVCTVRAVEPHNFIGENLEYYVLQQIAPPGNKFYVPTSNEKLVEKMRTLYSSCEINEFIMNMPDEDCVWIDDDVQRKNEYHRIISAGDRHELVRLIKTLYLHRERLSQEGKRLHAADEKFLSDAENMLYGEFAYSLDIPKDQVVEYIKEHLSAV